MSSFVQRLLSALLLVPLVLLILWVGGFLFKAFIAIVMVVAFYEFFMMARLEHAIGIRYMVMVASALYCMVGFIAAISVPISIIFLIMICVWASDSGAYFFGKTFGGPKLAPAISPNKTISGLVGACFFPFLVLGVVLSPDYQTAFAYAVMIGLIGQAGDIMISALKRRVGVKDTGRLIPGHGGVLDRIDALILVLIIFWLGMEADIIVWKDVSPLL